MNLSISSTTLKDDDNSGDDREDVIGGGIGEMESNGGVVEDEDFSR